MRLGFRATVLLLTFGPLLLLYPLSLLSSTLTSFWLQLLLKATESSGPTFIRLAQWASKRRDLFSDEFCKTFSRLHAQVEPHSWNYTKHCLKRAFGEDWKKVFCFLSKTPIWSGCVAQLYQAYASVDSVNDPEFQKLVENSERDDLFEAWKISHLQGVLGYLWSRRQEEASADDNVKTLQIESSVQGYPASHQMHSSGKPSGESQEATGISSDQFSEKDRLIPVAIKVLHPRVAQQVQMDLRLMRTSSHILGLLPGIKWLKPVELVKEFENFITQQIDLRNEAAYLERFQQNFQDVDYVQFPTPLRPFITRNVLVETFEESQPISSLVENDTPAELKQKIAKMAMDFLLKTVFIGSFVPGDVHPANICVQGVDNFDPNHEDQTTIVDLCDTLIINVRPSRCSLRLMLLDVGNITQLQEMELQNFKAILSAVVLGQGDKVGELFLHHAIARDCSDTAQFKLEMEELVNKAKSDATALGKIQVADLLSEVCKLLIAHKVKLESNFASVIAAILALDEIGHSLDPNLDILEVAKLLLLKDAASQPH